MLAIAVALAGCARVVRFEPSEPPEAIVRIPARALVQVSAQSLDFADDLDDASLILAIDRSLNYYSGPAQNQVFQLGDRQIRAGQMREALKAFRQTLETGAGLDDKKQRISRDFAVYRAAGAVDKGDVIFTGYYVPVLEGSLTRTDRCRYPIYKTPPDLLTRNLFANDARNRLPQSKEAAPYYSRREIDIDGALQNKNLEIVWVADPVDLFFLHIQGSGKIKLEDGKWVTVGVDKANGRPYRSMPASVLDQIRRDKGTASYANVKAWLKEKSDAQLNEILSYYERYIFFRLLDREPVGSLGQPVTPGRTIATDPDVFPAGALAFIRLSKPVFDDKGRIVKREAFSRFVLNQDKGSAIKGPGRVDLFCGFGHEAEAVAGSLKEKGELYFLLPK